MTSTAALPLPALRVLYALLAMALSAGWLVAAALPAQGAVNWGVESPVPGEVVSGSFAVTAFVESFQEDPPQAVRARLRHRDQAEGEVRNLQQQGQSDDIRRPGVRRSTWTGPAFAVEALANGNYIIDVSVVTTLYPDGSPWQGHEIVVDSPPVAKIETVRVTDADRRMVEVRWIRSPGADHVRYVLQRAAGDADFVDVHTAVPAGATTHIDVVPEHGEYRYRVKAVRAAADGSEREAVSEARSVTVTEDASGRPENEDGEIDGPLGGSGEDPDAAAPPPPATGGAAVPRLSARSPSAGGTGGGTGGVRSRAQVPTVAPPPDANSTFEEHLDYGAPPPEWEEEVLADGGGFDDEGTLTVFGGQELTGEQVLPPIAAGLVLTLGGLHIRRFLNT